MMIECLAMACWIWVETFPGSMVPLVIPPHHEWHPPPQPHCRWRDDMFNPLVRAGDKCR
jgi:hypothetical protein